MKNALVMLCLLLAPAMMPAQQPTVTAQPNTVYVGGDGKFETDPDTAVIQFTIGAQDTSSDAAYKRASAAAEAMRQALRQNGIDPKQAQLGSYSLQPVLDYKSAKRKVVGYLVTSSVTLKLKDFSKVGPLVTALSSIEDTANQSVDYTLDNEDAAKAKAVENAVAKARDLAETTAKAGGRSVGEMLYAAVDVNSNVIQPMVRYAALNRPEAPGMAAPTEEFKPHTITITAHVNAVFSLK